MWLLIITNQQLLGAQRVTLIPFQATSDEPLHYVQQLSALTCTKQVGSDF